MRYGKDGFGGVISVLTLFITGTDERKMSVQFYEHISKSRCDCKKKKSKIVGELKRTFVSEEFSDYR